ncbi:hypothetical protein Tco_0414139, partial [Tanacetum coccineum]
MAFLHLQELAVAPLCSWIKSLVFWSNHIQRQINDDLQFAAGLTLQGVEFLKQLSQTEVLKMLETRKTIAEVHIQVHKKIDSLTAM